MLCDLFIYLFFFFGLRIKNPLIHPMGDYGVHMVNIQRAAPVGLERVGEGGGGAIGLSAAALPKSLLLSFVVSPGAACVGR